MTELTYTRHGDYLLPDLTLSEQEPIQIGKYGLLRKTYLKTHRKILYTNLLTAGALHDHLAAVDCQVNERFHLIVTQMSAAQGVTEALKLPIKWPGSAQSTVLELALKKLSAMKSSTPDRKRHDRKTLSCRSVYKHDLFFRLTKPKIRVKIKSESC